MPQQVELNTSSATGSMSNGKENSMSRSNAKARTPAQNQSTTGDSTVTATENIVGAITTKKLPPLELRQKVWTRRLVVISFWLTAILVGLPIWWKTTTVYRATLPLQLMRDWGEGKVCSPQFPLSIVLHTPGIRYEEAQHLLKTTQDALDDLNEFSAHHLRLSHQSESKTQEQKHSSSAGHSGILDDEAADLTVRLISSQGAPSPSAMLVPHAQSLDVFYSPNTLPSSSTTSSTLATFIANELQALFSEEKSILAYLLSVSSGASTSSIKFPPEIISDLSRRSTRSVKYAPTYHITFSLFTPSSLPNAWEIEETLSHTFTPLLDALSPISNFTIDTQVQPYATFSSSIQPTYDEDQATWLLKKEDLGGFINAAEWPLSPSIGEGPTLNFILYVPHPSQTPLTIRSGSDQITSWLVPQWGGVSIYNPPSNTVRQQSLSLEDLRPHLLMFTRHLTQLLNVPSTPTNSLPLRLSSLGRQHSASLILRASTTLASLARLVVQLPSISIPDKAASSVDSSLDHLERACAALRSGKFHLALTHAREAEREAEQAFFEKSMVGQVYFPDEHKVAVYLPLLGPIAVPLILGAGREIKSYLASRRGLT